jgi:excisionase family DNA binding protein
VSTAAQQRPLLAIPVVASLTRLSETTIRRRIREGDLPAVKLGRLIRVDSDALDAWLARHQIETSADCPRRVGSAEVVHELRRRSTR